LPIKERRHEPHKELVMSAQPDPERLSAQINAGEVQVMRLLMRGVDEIYKDTKRNSGWLAYVMLVFLLYVVVASGAFVHYEWPSAGMEHPPETLVCKANDSPIPCFANAAYFTVINMTSVGFGDVLPHTLAGKIIACVNALVGYVLLAFFMAVAGLALTGEAVSRASRGGSGGSSVQGGDGGPQGKGSGAVHATPPSATVVSDAVMSRNANPVPVTNDDVHQLQMLYNELFERCEALEDELAQAKRAIVEGAALRAALDHVLPTESAFLQDLRRRFPQGVAELIDPDGIAVHLKIPSRRTRL
jgi:hypothetical protein